MEQILNFDINLVTAEPDCVFIDGKPAIVRTSGGGWSAEDKDIISDSLISEISQLSELEEIESAVRKNLKNLAIKALATHKLKLDEMEKNIFNASLSDYYNKKDELGLFKLENSQIIESPLIKSGNTDYVTQGGLSDKTYFSGFNDKLVLAKNSYISGIKLGARFLEIFGDLKDLKQIHELEKAQGRVFSEQEINNLKSNLDLVLQSRIMDFWGLTKEAVGSISSDRIIKAFTQQHDEMLGLLFSLGLKA